MIETALWLLIRIFKDGKEILHGVAKSFLITGQVVIERFFTDGVLDGLETHFTEKGVKTNVLVWQKGELKKEYSYFSDGVIKAETESKTKISFNIQPYNSKEYKYGDEFEGIFIKLAFFFFWE